MTTREEMRGWLEDAKRRGAKYVIIACDTFDYEDYPVEVHDASAVRSEIDRLDGRNMQRVMEVYDLALPFPDQLAEARAWHLPAGMNGMSTDVGCKDCPVGARERCYEWCRCDDCVRPIIDVPATPTEEEMSELPVLDMDAFEKRGR